MNLRILKKLSKRAAPYLPLLGDKREQFPAEWGENYHGLNIWARKHFERTVSVHTDIMREGEMVIAPKCREGSRFPYIKLYPPSHPWPGTIMVGGMSGYYEPEWEEESAWGALHQIVSDRFTDWDAVYREDESAPWLTRRLRTPSDIFAAADEMVRGRVDAEGFLR
ncbi:MAG: hypothetical protein KAY22_25705 [Rhizorhabdus sp.]|uniref:hypothetical protein n=1 Tax=Rhizorhabdus sp. TaxID=1968843 RepID=UPI001B70EE03|nr:hypothetical protein [Rhizorhabdus sp.]MBP8235695.1 hypothetical protein [Rhizorhabdus sp.]